MSSAIANQESLSILEVEMRKLEAVTREIVDELGYLQRREMRMRDTNGESTSTVRFLIVAIGCHGQVRGRAGLG